MNRMRWIALVAGVLLTASAGCATTGRVEALEQRVGDLESRIDAVDQKAEQAMEKAESAERSAEAAADRAADAARTTEAIFKKSVRK